jgi:hypothetical protein
MARRRWKSRLGHMVEVEGYIYGITPQGKVQRFSIERERRGRYISFMNDVGVYQRHPVPTRVGGACMEAVELFELQDAFEVTLLSSDTDTSERIAALEEKAAAIRAAKTGN